MGWVDQATKKAEDTATRVWTDVVGGVTNVTKEIIKGVESVGKTAVNTVNAVMRDPVPTLLSAGGALVGIPPYITMAAITAARGGNLEDVAKSAALAYATSSFMNNTQMGADIQNYTSNAWAGDFTDSMMDNFSLTPDQAIQVAKVSTAALSTSVASGMNAALTGKPIDQALASGFTSGLINAGTGSYFDSINKDPNWGFSPTALNMMKGATTTALNAAVNGKIDPAVAVGNYIAYATLNLGQSALVNTAKTAYKNLTDATKTADTAQDDYEKLKTTYDAQLAEGERLRTKVNAAAAAYKEDSTNPAVVDYNKKVAAAQGAIADYNKFKGQYDAVVERYGASNPEYASYLSATIDLANQAVANANAAAAAANTIYASRKELFDGLAKTAAAIDADVEKIKTIRADISEPKIFARGDDDTPNTAYKLQEAAQSYQTAYDNWTAAQTDADAAAKAYDKALAAVATREATIDALNEGVLTAKEYTKDGWILSNGMTLSPKGTFLTANADGVVTAAFADAGDAKSSTINLVETGAEAFTVAKYLKEAGLSATPEDVATVMAGWDFDPSNPTAGLEQAVQGAKGRAEADGASKYLRDAGLSATPANVAAVMEDWAFDPRTPTAGLAEAAQQIKIKAEEDSVVQYLEDAGLSATPANVAAVTEDWAFDPRNPTVGLAQAAQDIYDKTERDSVVSYLTNAGLSAAPEIVASVMDDLAFDPRNPTAGLAEATQEIYEKTEKESVANYLSAVGLKATPEDVATVMAGWAFDPRNPTAGLAQATQKIYDDAEKDNVFEYLQEIGLRPTAANVSQVMEDWAFDPRNPTAGLTDAVSEVVAKAPIRAAGINVDNDAVWESYKEAEAIYKEVFGEDATPEDLMKYFAPEPPSLAEVERAQLAALGKVSLDADELVRLDYDGDGQVERADARGLNALRLGIKSNQDMSDYWDSDNYWDPDTADDTLRDAIEADYEAENPFVEEEPPSTLPTDPILDDELEPPSTLPTDPILDNELEPPSTLPTDPILDNELDPPSTLPTDPILDDELEPPSTLPTDPILDNELEPPSTLPTDPILDDELEPPSTLPTDPILDDELEPPSTLPTDPILDDELEPPSTLPTDPILDDELEPPSTLPTDPILDDELEPPNDEYGCPEGFSYDPELDVCVLIDTTDTTKPSTLPKGPKGPGTPQPPKDPKAPKDPVTPKDPTKTDTPLGDFDLLGLLSLMGNTQQEQPTQPAVADMSGRIDIEDLLDDPLQVDARKRAAKPTMASGGSIDDLLALLKNEG